MTGHPDDPDRYETPAEPRRGEVRIRASRFIATVTPVCTGEEARRTLDEISREMHDATHHCWAWRLCSGEQAASDAGEPSGTAGRPILAAISSAGLVDLQVVVTRYFGGTKLGTGGLARAYREAAALVLEETPHRIRYHKSELEVTFGFPQTGVVEPLVSRFEAVKLESDYGEAVRLRLAVRRSLASKLATLLGEALRDPSAVQLVD